MLFYRIGFSFFGRIVSIGSINLRLLVAEISLRRSQVALPARK